MEVSVGQNPNALGNFAGCDLFLHLASRRLLAASTNIGMLKSRGSEGRCEPALHSIGATPADEHGEGRTTFANTLKYMFMATSANFGMVDYPPALGHQIHT
jgi:hypothetical protein